MAKIVNIKTRHFNRNGRKTLHLNRKKTRQRSNYLARNSRPGTQPSNTEQAIERLHLIWPVLFIACMVSAGVMLASFINEHWSLHRISDTHLNEWIIRFSVAVMLMIVTVIIDRAVKSYVMSKTYGSTNHLTVTAVLIMVLLLAYEFSRPLLLVMLGATACVFCHYSAQRIIQDKKRKDLESLANCKNIWEWLMKADKDAHLPPRWAEIGQEVYSRKTLLDASAKQLQATHLITQDKACFKLATTDVFVEKAQRLLSHRAQLLMICGTVTAVVSFVGMVVVAWYISKYGLAGKETDLALSIIKSSSAGALITAAFYVSVSLARALLHEASTLYARRHSLRFGRLFVYLREGNVSFEDLEKAFQWNAEYKSAFKDIKSEKVTESLLKSLLRSPSDALKALVEIYSKKKGRNILLGPDGERHDKNQ